MTELFNRIISLIVCPCLLAVTTSCSKATEEDKINVSSVFSEVAEITTLKYEYTDIYEYKEDGKQIFGHNVPLTTDDWVIVYGGTICLGYDLQDVTPVVDETNKTITVTVPKLEALSNTENAEVQKFIPIKNSINSHVNPDDMVDKYAELLSEQRKAKEETLLKDCENIAAAEKQYKSLCLNWLKAIPGVAGHYQIEFKEES